MADITSLMTIIQDYITFMKNDLGDPIKIQRKSRSH
jgi:hypothetical protein